MQDKRDDYEPIIADRRSREPLREDTQPLWRLVLALGAGLAVAIVLGWWFLGRSSSDGESTSAQTESASQAFSEERIEQEPTPPARDLETNGEIRQAPAPQAPPVAETEPAASAEEAATPENIPEVVPDDAAQEPAAPPAQVSVRLTSPDTQVQFELRGPLDSSPPLASKAGEVVAVAPGTYRVVASGAQLETFEQEVTFEGERPVEYTVELCAERKYERESLAGEVVEERTCTSTAQCESMFMVLSEYADQLVKDRAFRAQRCAKWRPNAAPQGEWTLNTDCGGATLATTCRIVIDEGVCMFAQPPRSARGTACPRVDLK